MRSSPEKFVLLCNPYLLASLLRSAGGRHFAASLAVARHIHAHLIKWGLLLLPPLPSALLDFYAKRGLLNDAHRLLEDTPRPADPVLCSSLLAALSHSPNPLLALFLFRRLYALQNLRPDAHILATLIKTSSRIRSIDLGKQAHAYVLVSPFFNDVVVKSSLVHMYCKCGAADDARKVFDAVASRNRVIWTAMISGYAFNSRSSEAIDLFKTMPGKNLFAWTALISGLVQSGHGIDALKSFVEMCREGIRIDDAFVLSSVIGATSDLAALELGKQLHSLVVALGYESSMVVMNALVDMYAKCSNICSARTVFEHVIARDVVSWTTMVVGEAQHGSAERALALFDEMLITGVKPNAVTFVGLIYACSHAGLVQKGRELFDSMLWDYQIKPSLQHYTCLLDLLSRSGHLAEAEDLIKTMPLEPDEAMWGALLSACKKHGDTQMSIRVADRLMSLGPRDPSTYVLLSNTYAVARKWESVADVRKLMADMGIRKEPGYSWIELGKESCFFRAGEVPNDLRDEIVGLLEALVMEMRKRGYLPDTSSVMHDLEEHEKEQHLFLHSERLAVAFGLLKSVAGAVIRVVKNLRVCGDCHTVLKLISSIRGREIVVRDATRFHHFKNGECSCGDFW